MIRPLGCMVCAGALLLAAPAHAGKAGDFLQTDNVSSSVVTYDLKEGTTRTIVDRTDISQNIGLHYYFVDDVRLGMTLQFTEQFSPAVAEGESRFRTFALLPQISWNFSPPFYAGLLFMFSPRTGGVAAMDWGYRGLLGLNVPVAAQVKLTFAALVVLNTHLHQTLGVSPQLGVSFLF